MAVEDASIREKKFHLLKNKNASGNFESMYKASVIIHPIFWTIKSKFFYYFPLHTKAFS